MKALWHVGNVVFCSIIGVLLFALVPSLVHLGSGTTDLLGFSFAYIPFLIASIRSGKRTINVARHIAHSLAGCVLAYILITVPLIEGENFINRLFIIGLGSLFAVSWVSGRKAEDVKKEETSNL